MFAYSLIIFFYPNSVKYLKFKTPSCSKHLKFVWVINNHDNSRFGQGNRNGLGR
jgi:hypothetical protein